jgi:hypothetical protein
MGYASYTVHRNGQEIEAGYAVEDVCNKEGCTAKIDRGLGYLCGETPGGDEHGCGGYFCGEHLLMSSVDDEPQRCERCYASGEKRRREEFCDQLVVQIRTMPGVKEADVVVDKPEVFIDFADGSQFVVGVA